MEHNNLRRMFDQVKMDPAREEAILASLLANKKEVQIVRKSKRLPAVIAVAVVMLLAVCAFAVATLVEPEFLSYYGAGQEEEALLCSTAVPMNLTDRNKGSTVRIRQIVADRYSMKVLMDFIAPENTVLDGDFYKLDAHWQSYAPNDEYMNSSWFSGWELADDENPADNKITIILSITTGDNINLLGAKQILSMENLYRDNIREQQVLAGKWDFTFTLPETDSGRYCLVNKSIDICGYNAQLTSLYVSPLSLVYDLEDGSDSLRTLQENLENGWFKNAALVTADGERIGLHGDFSMEISYALTEQDKDVGHIFLRPEKIIDPVEITALELFGQTVPLR